MSRGHHREVHRCGNEATWWENVGIDPMVSARALWLKHIRCHQLFDVVGGQLSVAAVTLADERFNVRLQGKSGHLTDLL